MFSAPRILASRAAARHVGCVRQSAAESLRAFTRPNIQRRVQPRIGRRFASTESSAANAGSRIGNFFYGTTLVLGLGIIYVYLTDTRASVHRWVVIPAFRTLYKDPEEAHEAGNRSLKQLWTFGLHPRERGDPDAKGDLEVEVFGQILRNPIGTSAGIDKHADIPDPLFAIGPSIIELGGATPMPQAGNEKPRVFRLTSQNAMINRYGLNSEGADHVAQRLRHRVRHFAEANGFGHDAQGETLVLDGHAGVPAGSLLPGRLLAVNIAKNKATPENDIDAVTKDYLYCAERLAPYADVLVVNVSSPNTPGLRSLQSQESLTKILSSVVKAARSVQRVTKPAVMVKVSPDEDSDEQVAGICHAIWESDVDGIVVGNTTNTRPTGPRPGHKRLTPLEEQHLLEMGGFSGPHLYEKTLSMVKKYKKLLGDQSRPDQSSPDQPSSDQSSSDRSTSDQSSSGPQSLISNLVGQVESSLQAAKQKVGPSGDQVTDSIQTGSIPPYNVSEKKDSEKQPLIRLPTDKFYDQPREEQDKFRTTPDGPETKQSAGKTEEQQQARKGEKQNKKAEQQQKIDADESKRAPELERRDQPKVIFATGGITNGKQALEILNAGASVAMVYTALVYGGVGTISRIKDEMRHELRTRSAEKKDRKGV